MSLPLFQGVRLVATNRCASWSGMVVLLGYWGQGACGLTERRRWL